ncbi:hypothetical protein BHE90_001843 [Fusarium euwallaceae]|uniref:Uncharacterized protein n=1 Tax=Fusarium euwallaceae TaxID=1147111 RepID=A0A430M6P4_9HYPO|nr:hypothetical protein BHE90_001843 [Fusarium euwallaceae]
MSLRVGFGDIVKAISLAKQVVTTYRGAPNQVKELADEISGLLGILEGAYDILQRRDRDLAEYERNTLFSILQGYTTTLNKLGKMYNENHTLATDASHGIGSHARKIGKRLVFEPDAIKDCRQEIIHSNAMLSSFMGLLNTPVVLETHRKVDTLVEHKSAQEDQQLLAWLTQLDFGKQHTDRLRRRQPGTGTWLIASEQFQAWLDQPQTTLLCAGMPGAGKSFIASITIGYLQQVYAHDQETCIAFLLCDFNSQQEQCPEDLLANLLKQLIQNRPIPTDLQELFLQYKSKPPGCRPMMDELLGCLATEISSYERVFVAIDALDEYKTENWTKLLEAIFGLQHASKLNVFVTLRPIQENFSVFDESGTTVHVLEIRAHQDDIDKFLDCKITDNLHFLKRQPQEEREKIQIEMKSRIGQAADGMFLLVSLYLDSITRCRDVNSIRKAITELPKGPDAYDKVYANTMARIQSRDTRDLAMHVLSWVAWTKRNLTVRELQHALAIIDGAETLDEDRITDAEDLVSSCEGLIILDPKTNIIRLVHYTIQEYLEATRSTWFPHVENDILRVCLEILSSPDFGNGLCETDVEFEKRLRDYPLYDYACRHWGDHAINSTAMDEAVFAFLQNVPKVEAASECQFAYWGLRQLASIGVTGLHLAARYGLDEVASRLISNGHRANQRDLYGESPLSSAAARGFQSTVATLLRHGAEVDSRDEFGRTALSVAAEHGHWGIVRLLVAHGADIDTLVEGQNLITWAVRKGDKDVTKCLITMGANINLVDPEGRTPLSYAAEDGFSSIVATLIDHGADPRLADEDGWTPLIWSCDSGKLDVVSLLLQDKHPDILGHTDRFGQTALLIASARGHADILKVLLERDSDRTIIKMPNKLGDTPLMVASKDGSKELIGLLLDTNCDVSTQNCAGGETALHCAARFENVAAALLLLDAGAPINATNSAMRTPLWYAARWGKVEAVETLLNAHAAVDIADSRQRTPLQMAIEHGHDRIAEILLDHKAELRASAVTEWAFLHVPSLTASVRVQKHVLRVALDAGMDADVLGLGILFS